MDAFWERPGTGEQRFYKIMLRMDSNATVQAAICPQANRCSRNKIKQQYNS